MANAGAPAAPVANPPQIVQIPHAHELNLSHPLTWFGNGADALSPTQFLTDVDQRRRRGGWLPAQTIDFVGVSLKGPALDWFRSSPRLVSEQADRDAFAGIGAGAWEHFQTLFLRSFLSGGKTHRIDQRFVFKQRADETVLQYRARCVEGYQTYRDERKPDLAKATTIHLDLQNLDYATALQSATLDDSHFDHAPPADGELEDAQHAADDALRRHQIREQQIASLGGFLTDTLPRLSADMMSTMNNYLVTEFAKYLLVDGLHHADVKKYAMELVHKGSTDVFLMWDYIHAYQNANHPPKHSTGKPGTPFVVPSGAADLLTSLLTGNADALAGKKAKVKFPHTQGATCGYCGRKNHTANQCMKKKKDDAEKKKKNGGQVASIETTDGQQQQSQQQQQQQSMGPPPQQRQLLHPGQQQQQQHQQQHQQQPQQQQQFGGSAFGLSAHVTPSVPQPGSFAFPPPQMPPQITDTRQSTLSGQAVHDPFDSQLNPNAWY